MQDIHSVFSTSTMYHAQESHLQEKEEEKEMWGRRRNYPCSQGTSKLPTEQTCEHNGTMVHVLTPWTESWGSGAESVGG